MIKFLILKHKLRLKIWQKKFKISNYKIFWMGFGEGLLIGFILSYLIVFLKNIIIKNV